MYQYQKSKSEHLKIIKVILKIISWPKNRKYKPFWEKNVLIVAAKVCLKPKDGHVSIQLFHSESVPESEHFIKNSWCPLKSKEPKRTVVQ
jgi:hypothetical protein